MVSKKVSLTAVNTGSLAGAAASQATGGWGEITGAARGRLRGIRSLARNRMGQLRIRGVRDFLVLGVGSSAGLAGGEEAFGRGGNRAAGRRCSHAGPASPGWAAGVQIERWARAGMRPTSGRREMFRHARTLLLWSADAADRKRRRFTANGPPVSRRRFRRVGIPD